VVVLGCAASLGAARTPTTGIVQSDLTQTQARSTVGVSYTFLGSVASARCARRQRRFGVVSLTLCG